MSISKKKGFWGVSPLLFFLFFYISVTIIAGDFGAVPIAFAFFLSSVFAVAVTRDLNLSDRVTEYGRGAGTTKVMFMIWVFLSAGIFTGTAEAMGCVKETVDAILMVLPARFIYLGVFLASCAISMATGSGIGSIVAVAPVAIQSAEALGMGLPIMCSAVVCGAMFGDNLSFISDTTIIATSSQGCDLKDKFRANLWMAAPACIATCLIYLYIGKDVPSAQISETIEYVKLLPYIAVLTLSIIGVDVLVVLLSGTFLCLLLGVLLGSYDFMGWINAAAAGLDGMGVLALTILMASGLLALIKHNGGIDYIVYLCMKKVKGHRSAEVCISLLSALLCVCTANNTIAIISVSEVVKKLSVQFGVEPRRAASLMDTASCVALELLPYSLHLLVIAELAGVSTTEMIPFMFYAFCLGIALVLSLIFKRRPKRAII